MKKIIVTAESAGGKDHLLTGLTNMGLKPCIKTTTRPIRSNEIDGITYHYTNNDDFVNLLTEMIVYQKFDLEINCEKKIWFYGLTKEQFDLGQVCIMTPAEINSLSSEQRNVSTVIYVNIDESIRRKRLEKRNDKNDSITRRIDSDAFDFKDFTNYDILITDPLFDVADIYGSL